MTVQQQADSIMEAFNQNKEDALTAVSALIAERTFVMPGINWDRQRRDYWIMVKQCIESMDTKLPTP